MSFADNIKTLCKQEGISLTKLSELTGIGYTTIRRYAKGPKTPTLEDIEKKILSVERFEKYRSLLLGTEKTIPEKLDPNNPVHERFRLALEQICERGLEDEALAVLEALGSPKRK